MKSRAFQVISWIGLLGLGGYGFFIEPAWIDVSFHRPTNQGLTITNYSWTKTTKPEAEKEPRFRVVQISDLHLHRFGRTEEMVIEKINALKPNLLLLTGDIADRPESLEVLDTFLEKVTAKHKYAILGNWEYWGGVNLQALRRIYKRHGVTLLVDECVEYSHNGLIYQVAGLDDFTAGNPDERTIYAECKDNSDKQVSAYFRSNVPSPKPLILMQHSPGYFEGRTPLEKRVHWITLSGHTHGGQVSIFGIPLWTPPGSGQFVSGWYVTGYGDLYVSRGIGTSVAPFRLGSRPEIAVFDTN